MLDRQFDPELGHAFHMKWATFSAEDAAHYRAMGCHNAAAGYDEIARRHLQAALTALMAQPSLPTGHACWKCQDRAKPCVEGNPRSCGYPVANNH